MNREILFRAKELDTNDWVIGSLYNECIISHLEIDDYLDEEDWFRCRAVIRCIDPKTIGQYTGLKDKNGVKIFEGDIVECVIGLKYAVVFSSYANFGLKPFSINVENIEFQSIDNIYAETSLFVVGNIYDK